ncbi:cbb3-type cytochrome c oxidase N-terminal domain-containing protein [Olivibacter sp. CPCC 100613]|uniref:cbb3-type cytochrome c oxidase N-terminal domain-containing protein n=1 Tax=Olivibacter sp. CPCC 100613 TaxID=3079931 RepID=UPI002FFAC051
MNNLLLQINNATSERGWGSGNIHQDVLLISLIIVVLTVLIAAIVLNKAFKTIVHVMMPEIEAAAKAATKAKQKEKRAHLKQWWNNVMGLRPLSEEEDLVIDHAYDDIRELDNPTPAWFMGLFYATMVFGVVYLSVYHVFGWGMNQDDEYKKEMRVAEQERKAYLASQVDNVDENSVEVDKSPEVLAEGKAIFDQNCIACHGAVGEGGIGPNLTDNYWLHGASIKDVFKTIKRGVPDKGMIAWEQQLSPSKIAQVANYILSLQGTNPPNAKAPQGDLNEQHQSPN